MRNGIPFAYTLYRVLWTILHLGLVGLVVMAAIVWFLDDGQGVAIAGAIWSRLTEIQTTVANAIPYPWNL